MSAQHLLVIYAANELNNTDLCCKMTTKFNIFIPLVFRWLTKCTKILLISIAFFSTHAQYYISRYELNGVRSPLFLYVSKWKQENLTNFFFLIFMLCSFVCHLFHKYLIWCCCYCRCNNNLFQFADLKKIRSQRIGSTEKCCTFIVSSKCFQFGWFVVWVMGGYGWHGCYWMSISKGRWQWQQQQQKYNTFQHI